MGFLQGARSRDATVAFLKEPGDGCGVPAVTLPLPRVLWGGISSPAVPSNAAWASWFGSASLSITGTRRDTRDMSGAGSYPPGDAAVMAPRCRGFRLHHPPEKPSDARAAWRWHQHPDGGGGGHEEVLTFSGMPLS